MELGGTHWNSIKIIGNQINTINVHTDTSRGRGGPQQGKGFGSNGPDQRKRAASHSAPRGPITLEELVERVELYESNYQHHSELRNKALVAHQARLSNLEEQTQASASHIAEQTVMLNDLSCRAARMATAAEAYDVAQQARFGNLEEQARVFASQIAKQNGMLDDLAHRVALMASAADAYDARLTEHCALFSGELAKRFVVTEAALQHLGNDQKATGAHTGQIREDVKVEFKRLQDELDMLMAHVTDVKSCMAGAGATEIPATAAPSQVPRAEPNGTEDFWAKPTPERLPTEGAWGKFELNKCCAKRRHDLTSSRAASDWPIALVQRSSCISYRSVSMGTTCGRTK